MATTLTLREVKGSPLTFGEMDSNLTSIDNNKQENYHSALKWCIDHVDEVVIGSKNITQLAQNHSVINFLWRYQVASLFYKVLKWFVNAKYIYVFLIRK